MYTRSAPYYDQLYSFKDYQAEANALTEALNQMLPDRETITVLDVGCGSAEHHRFLPDNIAVEGVDIEEEFVAIAKAKNPNCKYVVGDMHDLNMGKTYDAVICMFSSIGYMQTLERTRTAMKAMADHVAPGGVLIVEPWFTPEGYTPGFVSQLNVDTPELQICRMTFTEREGDVSILNFHYAVAEKGKGMVHFDEQHRLGLLTMQQMLEAMDDTGLDSRFDATTAIPRDLYIGIKS